MAIAVVFAVVSGVVVTILVVYWWRSTDYIGVESANGRNNDDDAVTYFLDLVRTAKEEVLIHDEGNATASLYNDDQVIQVVQERLEHGVTVRCLFNRRDQLRMVTELQRNPKLHVHYLRRPPPRHSDVHFKIIDRGKMAYLSRHLEGGEREFRVFDCSKSPRRVRSKLFGKYLTEFDRGVEELADRRNP